MSDPETEAVHALERLFLQSGMQGGQLIIFLPFLLLLPPISRECPQQIPVTCGVLVS